MTTRQRTFAPLILVIVLSLIPLFDLLKGGLPITHDGVDHVARIANFYRSLSEGNIVPRWAGNLNWGFGHPVLMFLYPLPSYIASLFHLFGFSFIDSTKLVFAVSFVVSNVFMYLWLSSQWGSIAGLVGAIMYGFAPYRFVDLYVRGAIGEHVAFVFAPVIFLGLRLIALATTPWARTRGGLILTGGIVGLMLSHNAVSMMFLPIILAYGVYLYLCERKDKRLFALFSIWFVLLGFLLTAFFWMPAFLEGKYTLRDIVTQGEIGDRFVPVAAFFSGRWNYGSGNEISKALGFVTWMFVGISVKTAVRKSKKDFIVSASALLLFFLSLFLMTKWSEPVWRVITILQKFQFPWRFLSATVFLGAVIAADVVAHLPRRLTLIVSASAIALLLTTTIHMWRAQGYTERTESYFTGIYNGTTDTGESSPIWSVRFMERQARAPIEIIVGAASTENLTRSTTEHSYRITVRTRTRFVENTLYFPDWNVTANSAQLPVEFQDPQFRGLITFWLSPGVYDVRVTFGDTKLRKAAMSASMAGMILLFLSGTMPLWKRRNLTFP